AACLGLADGPLPRIRVDERCHARADFGSVRRLVRQRRDDTSAPGIVPHACDAAVGARAWLATIAHREPRDAEAEDRDDGCEQPPPPPYAASRQCGDERVDAGVALVGPRAE